MNSANLIPRIYSGCWNQIDEAFSDSLGLISSEEPPSGPDSRPSGVFSTNCLGLLERDVSDSRFLVPTPFFSFPSHSFFFLLFFFLLLFLPFFILSPLPSLPILFFPLRSLLLFFPLRSLLLFFPPLFANPFSFPVPTPPALAERAGGSLMNSPSGESRFPIPIPTAMTPRLDASWLFPSRRPTPPRTVTCRCHQALHHPQPELASLPLASPPP